MDELEDFILYKRVRELRIEKEWSQHHLAELLGMSQSNISLWESGKGYPDVINLKRLAEIFEVSADYLLGLSEY